MNSPLQVEPQETDAGSVAAPRRSPHELPGVTYGWLSRLRSYFIFDPLIWLYTLVLGIVALPGGMFDKSGRRLHWFSRTWSWLIMKTIMSPVKVTGLDRIDTSKAHVYAVNHASAMDIPAATLSRSSWSRRTDPASPANFQTSL